MKKILFVGLFTAGLMLGSYAQDNIKEKDVPPAVSTSFKTDGIITGYHFSINGQAITSNTSFLDFTFHAVGMQDIGLYVTDDLGLNSDTIHRQVLIIP